MPPLTLTILPFIQLDSGLARKCTTLATSFTDPMRFAGDSAQSLSTASASVDNS